MIEKYNYYVVMGHHRGVLVSSKILSRPDAIDAAKFCADMMGLVQEKGLCIWKSEDTTVKVVQQVTGKVETL
jgi:hypothetical protein